MLRFQVSRGLTLIDTLVGIGLMLVVFVGIAGAFEFSVDAVTNDKARAGAIALGDERMEYIRSLPYASVGTVGGIPYGPIPQSEQVVFNNIAYTRRTYVEYDDDPKDGTGASDANHILEDYKTVKVDVSWTSRSGTRHSILVARVSPAAGLETNVPGGTLIVSVLNALSQPVSGASVSVTNTTANPTININTFTDTSGQVTLLGATTTGTYSVVVTQSGYSTDQTYSGPPQGPLTVTTNNTTTGTFHIDVLSSMTVVTDVYGTSTQLSTIPFAMHGAKLTSSSPVVYKYNQTLGGSGSPTTTISNLEYDTYTMSVSSGTGYDLAYSCQPQPIVLPPNSATTTILYLAPHSTNSLAVKVSSNATSALIPGANVELSKTGYDATSTTDSCGETYFGSLAAGTYTLTVAASGYTTYTNASLSVASSTQAAVLLN